MSKEYKLTVQQQNRWFLGLMGSLKIEGVSKNGIKNDVQKMKSTEIESILIQTLLWIEWVPYGRVRNCVEGIFTFASNIAVTSRQHTMFI